MRLQKTSGWVELADPSTGQVFYFNEKENLSSWERPGHVESMLASRFDKSVERLASHSFATFGFGGKLCTWNRGQGHAVTLRHCHDIAPLDDIANVERAKRDYGIDGPLNSCEESVVMRYLEGRATEKSEDLLWSLILIAARSKGRLRSDEGVRNPDGPEAAIVNLLLSDNNNNVGVGTKGVTAFTSQVGKPSTWKRSTDDHRCLQSIDKPQEQTDLRAPWKRCRIYFFKVNERMLYKKHFLVIIMPWPSWLLPCVIANVTNGQ